MVPLPPPPNRAHRGPARCRRPRQGPTAPSAPAAPPRASRPARAASPVSRRRRRAPLGSAPARRSPDPSSRACPVRRRRRWWIPVIVVAGLLVSLVIGASVVEVPYYGIAPGDARPVAPRIDVEGAQAFASEGEVLFVTVSVPRLTALGRRDGLARPQRRRRAREEHPRRPVAAGEPGEQPAPDGLLEGLRHLRRPRAARATTCRSPTAAWPSTRSAWRIAGDGVTCARQAPAAAALKVRDLITAIDGRPINLPADIGAGAHGPRSRASTVTVTVPARGHGRADRACRSP